MKIEVGSVINELRIKQKSYTWEENWLRLYVNLMPCQIMKEASLLQPLMNWHFLRINLKLTCRIFFTTKNEPIYNYIETIKLLIQQIQTQTS